MRSSKQCCKKYNNITDPSIFQNQSDKTKFKQKNLHILILNVGYDITSRTKFSGMNNYRSLHSNLEGI